MVGRRIISVLLICFLTLAVLVPASARAETGLPPGYDRAIQVLSYFKIVSGDAQGYRPLDTLTRAEIAKLATVSMAVGDQQAYYQSTSYFPDMAGHWAQGFVGLARQLSIMQGYPDGTFRPDAPVTYAEAVTLLARVAGLGPSGGEWPDNWLSSARDAGIIPANATFLTDPGAPARRGDVFVMLYRALTEIKDFSGMSLLQRRFKSTPPVIAAEPLPTSTQDTAVVVKGTVDGAQSVTINDRPATLSGNKFEANVALEVGSNDINISATDIAGNENLQRLRVVRENTEAASITINGPHSVPAGQSGHLDVIIRDTNGARITNYFNLVADVPGKLGSFDPFSGAFYASQYPAAGVMTFSIGSAKATWNMTVGSGSLVTLKIVPEDALVKQGKILEFSLSGTDTYGNTVDVTSLSPVWKATGGVIDEHGKFAPTTAGTATVTAVVGDQTVTSKVAIYSNPAKISVGAPGKMTANRSDTSKVDIQVQDASGNLVPDYSGAVYITSTSTGSAYPTATTIQVQNGKATATLRAGSVPGSVTLVVSGGLLASGSATFNVDAQMLGSIFLSTDPTTINADGQTQQMLTVTAVDTRGKPMLAPLNPPLTVHLVSSGGLTFESTGTTTSDIGLGALDAGTGTVATRVNVKAGSQEGSANLAGMVSAPREYASVSVRSLPLRLVHVGAAAKLSFDPVQGNTAGTTVPLYVRLLDDKGNQVTDPVALQAALLTLKDQTGRSYPATIGLVAGKGRAEFDVLLHQATTYNFTATATLTSGSGTVQPASQSVAIAPGNPVSLVMVAQPSTLRSDGGISRTTITASVQDAYGNVVPTGSYPVNFQRLTSAGATGTLPSLQVATNQGVARLLVPSGSGIGTDTFSAYTDGLTTRNTVQVKGVIMGVPTKLAMRYGDNNADGQENGSGDNTGSIGQPLTVYVDLLDNTTPGNVVTSENGQMIMLTVKNLTTGDQQTLATPIQFGTAKFTIQKTQATTYSLQATLGGYPSVGTIGLGGALPDLVLRSGQSAGLTLATDLTQIRATPGKSYATLTVGLVDASGNPAVNTNPTPITIQLKASNVTYGNFTQDNTPNGTATDTYTVSVAPNAVNSGPVNWYATATPGPVTIAASATGYATGTAVVTTRLIGAANNLQVGAVTDTPTRPLATDHNTVQGQDVQVSMMDFQGYQITDYGTNGEQITLTTPSGAFVAAYYDYSAGLWKTLDQTPSAPAASYPNTYTVPAFKGQALFRVRAASSGTFTYSLSATGAGTLPPVIRTVSGRFVGGPLARLILTATPSYNIGGATLYPVAGGGQTIQVQAQFVDQYGNLLTDQAGSVYFDVSNSSYGQFLSTNINTVNGVATAFFQSTTTLPMPNGPFQVRAYTPVTQPNGNPLTQGSPSSPAVLSLTMDSIAPTVQSVVMASGGPADQTVGVGDNFTFTYSEGVKGDSIVTGLQPGGTLTGAAVSNLRAFFNHNGGAPDTITFGGGLNLGTITMVADNMDLGPGNNSVAYAVSSITLDATGTQVTVVLGAPLGGAAVVPLTLNADPTKTTFTPIATVQDPAGNATVTTSVQLNPGSGF